MKKIALGYNPAFLAPNIDIYQKADLIELGIDEYLKYKSSNKDFSNLSLHISKSPIVDSTKSQDLFIEKLIKKLNLEDFISIGFHITGNMFEGIGQLGFSSHYSYSSLNEKQAIEFLKKIQKMTGLETWIENANFYSKSYHEVVESYKSLNRICEKSNSKIILDLSHLFIDCSNLGINPAFLIGIIDWKNVKEIHLSGIVEDQNGIFHDGHSRVVDERVWELFKQILPLLGNNVFINLEHTSANLALDGSILKDLSKLQNILNNHKVKTTNHYPIDYVKRYYTKLLPKWIPDLVNFLENSDYTLDSTVDGWIDYVLKNDINLSLSKNEIISCPKNKVFYAYEHYLEYIQGISNEIRC